MQFWLPVILNNSLASYDNKCVSWMHLHDRKWVWQPKIFGRTATWTCLSKYLNPPLSISATDKIWDTFRMIKLALKLDKHSIVLITRVSMLRYILKNINTYTLNTDFHCSATIGDHIHFAECIASNSSSLVPRHRWEGEERVPGYMVCECA